jgi:hypothetical protein
LSEHHGDGFPGAAIRIEEPEVETYQQALLAKNYKYDRPGLIDTELAHARNDRAGSVWQ